MAPETNAWCERLGISVPSVAATRTHREANTYALLIVTLLEHGRPMTLEERPDPGQGKVTETFSAAAWPRTSRPS